jgi:hypothetical protein
VKALRYLDDIGYGEGLFFCFFFGFVVRLIPEVLSFPHPIGFDTVYYASRIESGVVWYHWSSVFSSWLLYAMLVPVYNVVSVDPFLFLKFAAPALYALNLCGIYYFSRKALGWDVKKGLVAAFFFAFQLAFLRISWDLYRNMLGLAILLFALPLIQKLETKRDFALFVLLSLFVVFGHETASVLLFAVVVGVMAKDYLKGETKRLMRVLAAIIPAVAVFSARWWVPLLVSIDYVAETTVISVYQSPSRPGGLFFLTNYLSLSGSIQYPTYLDLFSHVLSLFVVLYLVCLPLVFVGFFRDRILDSWTLFLLVGAFSSLIVPLFALDLWDRWMFLLVYPFTFYAVNGIGRVLESKSGVAFPKLRWIGWMKVSRKFVGVILFLTILFGALLMTAKFSDNGVFSIPATGIYLPSTMLQNTVPLRDVESVVETMDWLNEHMTTGSGVLLHPAFFSWGKLCLDKENVIVNYVADVEGALSEALENGLDPVYLVWWGENVGWYRSIVVPGYFMRVFESDRIVAFQYLG